MLLAGIYSVRMDSRLKISGMTTITVIIYWDWYDLFRDSIRQTKTLNIFDDAVGFSSAGKIELACYRVSDLVLRPIAAVAFKNYV